MPAAVASAGPRVVTRSDIRDALDGLRQLEEGLSAGLETLPAAQQSEATMAAQARVASAVAVTATSARSQEPSGPVKAYQRVPSAVQSAVGSWHKEHTRGTLSKNSLRYASQGLIKWGGIRLGRNRGRVWGVGACGSLADVDDRPVRQVV